MSGEQASVSLRDLVVTREPWDASASGDALDVYDSDGFANGEPIVRAAAAIDKGAQQVQAGDVLLSTSARGPRRTWVVGEARGRAQVATAEWQVLRSDVLAPSYLRHLLVSNDAQMRLNTPGTPRRRSKSRTAMPEVALPVRAVESQERIAQVLDHVDALRSRRALVARRIAELERSIFASTFRGADTERERVPLGGLLSEPAIRGVEADLHAHGSFPVLRPPDIRDGRLKLAEVRRVSYSDASLARTALADGDLLLACDPARDDVRCAIARPGSAVWFMHARLWRLRTDGRHLLPEYLRAWILSDAGRAELLRVWTADRRAAGDARLARLTIPVPAITDQHAFAEAAGAIDRLEGRILASSERLDELLGVLRDLAFRGDLNVA